jgi:hypothetical protein
LRPSHYPLGYPIPYISGLGTTLDILNKFCLKIFTFHTTVGSRNTDCKIAPMKRRRNEEREFGTAIVRKCDLQKSRVR